jgi:hypothetical protein
MISNVLIGCGLVSLAIIALDVWLPKSQREAVELAVTRAWSMLDDAKNLSLVEWLRKPNLQVWLISLAVFVAATLTAWDVSDDFPKRLNLESGPIAYTVVTLMGFGIGAFLGRHLILRLSQGNMIAVSTRVVVYFLVLSVVTLVAFFSWFMAQFYEDFIDTWTKWPWSEVIATAARLLAGNIFVTLYIFFLTAAIPLILAMLAQLTLAVCEYLIRHLLQYEKGPAAAISGVATAIGGLLKAFL